MLFSSITFIYYFLPIVLFFYFLIPNKYKNFLLLIASLFFYYWGEQNYIMIMLVLTIINFILGIYIDKYRGKSLSKVLLILSIIINLGTLTFFKYTNFILATLNNTLKRDFKFYDILLPIGISFYTFQILSYTIDLYRGKIKVQKNFFDFATYVVLFPQLIAGPIVRYIDIERELSNRKHTVSKISHGIARFIMGLSKKVILSNSFYELCLTYKTLHHDSIIFIWIYAFAYAFHIYFDFSGYSDMAIGLGKIFGFDFPENFNYPYISRSISEFWRRWHISLGTWFRDYVYILLGGNRVSKVKLFRNILIVWILTGMWHGANWTFIVWGLMFGILILVEKIVSKHIISKPREEKYFESKKNYNENNNNENKENNKNEKIRKLEIKKTLLNIVSHAYTIFFILISWIIFDADNLSDAFIRIKGMLGLNGLSIINNETLYYLRSYIVLCIIAIISSTPILKIMVDKIKKCTKKIISKRKREKTIKRKCFSYVVCKAVELIEPLYYLILLIISTSYLIDGSFNPFIYFRF